MNTVAFIYFLGAQERSDVRLYLEEWICLLWASDVFGHEGFYEAMPRVNRIQIGFFILPAPV